MSDSDAIKFRIEPARKAAYAAAAKRAGVPLSHWLKLAADAALTATERKSLPKMRAPGRPKNAEVTT